MPSDQRILATVPAREEGVIERTVRTYAVSLAGVVVATLGCGLTWLTADRAYAAVVLVGTLLATLGVAGADAVIAVWLRWESVSRDAGLQAIWTGIPDILWVWPDGDGVKVLVSGLAVEPLDAIAAEEKLAAGLGYASGSVVEKHGRVRRSRRRYLLRLSHLDGLLETIGFDLGATTSANATPVMIGRSKALCPLTWHLMEAPGHLVMQGETRSGKTALVYSILAQLASMCDVTVVGVDPTGVLAMPWDRDGWAVGTHEMADAANLLEGEVVEMETRIARLAGDGVDKIGEVTHAIPLRVIVIEEYPGVIRAARSEDAAAGRKPAERVATRIEAALGRLVAEGAKVAIRVILLAQRASSLVLDTDSRGNFAVRITLRVGASESIKMLHDDLDSEWVAALKAYKNGVGVIEMPGLAPTKFKAAYLGEDLYERYVTAVRVGRDLAAASATGVSRGTSLAPQQISVRDHNPPFPDSSQDLLPGSPPVKGAFPLDRRASGQTIPARGTEDAR